jgi:hypothetical protein
MKAKILKNMIIDGRKVQSGDIVDVKGWLHAKKLASNRYIQFIEEEAVVEAPKESKPKAAKKETAAAK